MKPEIIISIFALVVTAVNMFLQWRTAAKRAKSGEALDWSTAANNLRKEIDAQSTEILNLREEIMKIRKDYKTLQELGRRFVKELARRGEPIILSEEENALLYDTARFRTTAK